MRVGFASWHVPVDPGHRMAGPRGLLHGYGEAAN